MRIVIASRSRRGQTGVQDQREVAWPKRGIRAAVGLLPSVPSFEDENGKRPVRWTLYGESVNEI